MIEGSHDWRWLASTKELQEDAFAIEFPLEGEELADYIRWNSLALIKEVAEVLDCVDWKPWKLGDKGKLHRQRALEEIVDVAHFLGNIAVALDIDDDELQMAYRDKQAVNEERQAEGY